jgi:hypothetical protein
MFDCTVAQDQGQVYVATHKFAMHLHVSLFHLLQHVQQDAATPHKGLIVMMHCVWDVWGDVVHELGLAPSPCEEG